jgi:hypothetical protein
MHQDEVIRMADNINKEYITEKEAITFSEFFKRNLEDYKEKDELLSDKEWLEGLFKKELPEIKDEEAKRDALEIIGFINEFDDNLKSANEAAQKGISKEKWLADKMQEISVGVAINEYGQVLQSVDEFLYEKNAELADSLRRSVDGHIKMSPNLDGNIAETMIAKTTELSGFVQDKNIKVEVRDVYTKNSIDVRVTNLDTGKYQNYQMKFGKDAKTTIDLIERGNYTNQRLIVPSDQLEEIQNHFKSKGLTKTISDHIEAWGTKSNAFTKKEVKELQIMAQEDGFMPAMDYNHYQTKELAMSIGKNSGVMALQAMAVTTGFNIASKVLSGENIDADEMIEIAIKTGATTSIKVVTAGTLQVAIRKGIISFIPKFTPAGVVAQIACAGIENVKILAQMASGDLSMIKGIDQMGRVTTSMIGGFMGMAKGTAFGAGLTAWIPVVGAPIAVLTGLIGGAVGYFAGSKLGDIVYSAAKKVASVVKDTAKAAFEGLKSAGRTIKSGFSKVGRMLSGLFR